MAKPEIRLKGFEGEWKECPLGDITTSFSGGTPSAGVAKYYGGNIPFIRSGEIAEDKTQLFITEEGLKASSAKIVEKGTLLYALYGATSGEVSISRINGAINQAILAIYPKKGYSSKYLSHYLRAKKDIIVGTLLQGGQGNLSGALVKSFIINLPESCNEQNAIAEYFEHIDNAIQSTSKKIVSLKQMKQACLVSMFPQAGETTPRVRFKGFEGKWGYSSLGEIFEERVESNIYGEMLSVTMNNGVIKASENGRFDNSNSDKSKYKVVKVNDIAYNSMRMWQGASGCSQYEGIVSPAYTVVVPCEGIDSLFFSYMFKTLPMITLFRLHSQGLTSDTWNLKYPAFSKIKVIYPKEIQEQQRIASYFRSLDKQISMQEKRLERLKQIKAACLDKMFV